MLNDVYHIFIVGIRGVAMANMARIFEQMGKHVEGSDIDASFITDSVLSESNIKVIHSFEARDLPYEVDLVVYAASHGGIQNPQVVEAQERDIPVIHQAELLGMLLAQFNTSIGVAGCHGKTTTSALLAYALEKLSRDVSYMVGVSKFNDNFGGQYGGDEYFVVEADEYGMDPPDNITPKFHFLKPDYSIITNIDHDHPDVYETLDDTKKAFKTYALQSLQKDIIIHQLIICFDDAPVREFSQSLPQNSYITYGTRKGTDVHVSHLTPTKQGMKFTLSSTFFDIKNETVDISLFGEKNVLNATAAIAMLLHIGFDMKKIVPAIKGFIGAKRRFEFIRQSKGIMLFDDYAHHPAEIAATIAAARDRFPKRRIVLLFQPHTYSRTKRLEREFVKALSQADQVIMLPIFASAREEKEENSVTSHTITAQINKKNKDKAFAAASKDVALAKLEQIQQKNDIIFTMGAGDVYTLAPHILK